MTRLAGVIRGLLHRGGSTVMIFAAALVASAAAATGPVYYAAARTSILHDTVASTSYLGRGFEANVTGAVNRLRRFFESYRAGNNRALDRLAWRVLFVHPVLHRRVIAFGVLRSRRRLEPGR